jgi:hypothetical protein
VDLRLDNLSPDEKKKYQSIRINIIFDIEGDMYMIMSVLKSKTNLIAAILYGIVNKKAHLDYFNNNDSSIGIKTSQEMLKINLHYFNFNFSRCFEMNFSNAVEDGYFDKKELYMSFDLFNQLVRGCGVTFDISEQSTSEDPRACEFLITFFKKVFIAMGDVYRFNTDSFQKDYQKIYTWNFPKLFEALDNNMDEPNLDNYLKRVIQLLKNLECDNTEELNFKKKYTGKDDKEIYKKLACIFNRFSIYYFSNIHKYNDNTIILCRLFSSLVGEDCLFEILTRKIVTMDSDISDILILQNPSGLEAFISEIIKNERFLKPYNELNRCFENNNNNSTEQTTQLLNEILKKSVRNIHKININEVKLKNSNKSITFLNDLSDLQAIQDYSTIYINTNRVRTDIEIITTLIHEIAHIVVLKSELIFMNLRPRSTMKLDIMLREVLLSLRNLQMISKKN